MSRIALLAATIVALPFTQAGAQQPPRERTLHLGAQVRVKVPKIDSDWIDGTVVGAKGSPTCFAVRLEHTDAQGRQQYAYLAGVTELQVDRRTNAGTLTVGLPPAAAEDWEAWSRADLAAAAARCQR